MAQYLHIIAELIKRIVITMIDIIAALIGFGAVLIFPFVTIQFLYETYEDIFKDD